MHLSQEWNFGTPTTLPSPATPPSPLTATPEAIFPLTWYHMFNMLTYKIIATCIEHATALRTNNTRVKRALLFTNDKLLSGSSLEGKAFLRNHKLWTLRLSTSGNTKPWSLKPSTSGLAAMVEHGAVNFCLRIALNSKVFEPRQTCKTSLVWASWGAVMLEQFKVYINSHDHCSIQVINNHSVNYLNGYLSLVLPMGSNVWVPFKKKYTRNEGHLLHSPHTWNFYSA